MDVYAPFDCYSQCVKKGTLTHKYVMMIQVLNECDYSEFVIDINKGTLHFLYWYDPLVEHGHLSSKDMSGLSSRLSTASGGSGTKSMEVHSSSMGSMWPMGGKFPPIACMARRGTSKDLV